MFVGTLKAKYSDIYNYDTFSGVQENVAMKARAVYGTGNNLLFVTEGEELWGIGFREYDPNNHDM